MADRKISDLTALTAPAAGDYLPIVDISEVAAASKNKRITIEELFRGVPLGTAAAPSIAIEGDENTGIYSPGADQLAISTGGTGRLFVDASGNVGIGAAPSAYKSSYTGFDIRTGSLFSAAGVGLVSLASNVYYNNSNQFIYKETDGATLYQGYSGVHTFHTAGSGTAGTVATLTERMRLTSAGLLGLGTSSPVAFLHVSGSGASSCRLTDTQSYNFGTSGPTLDLTGNDSSGANTLFARLKGNPNNGNADRGFLDILTRVDGVTTSTLQVGTGLAANVLIPNGRVGIGTSSPSAKLEIRNDVAAATSLDTTAIKLFNNLDGGSGIEFSNAVAGKSKISFGVESTGTGTDDTYLGFSTCANAGVLTERFRVTSAGRVGIGTTSPAAGFGTGVVSLDVVGPIFARGPIAAHQTNAGVFQYTGNDTTIRSYGATSGSGAIAFNTGGGGGSADTERARIDSSGRLLVGTSTARQANYGGAGLEAQVNFCGSTINTASAIFTRDSNDTDGYRIYLGKTRATSIGSFVNVAQNDELGSFWFGGANEGIFRPGASIGALVDAEPSTAGDTTDMPGRLVFSTTADGAATPTERLRITSAGQVRLAGAGITFNGDTAAANELDDYEEGTWTPVISGASTSGTGTYTVQSGRYTKVGRSVYVAGTVAWTAHDGTGTMRIAGLPFTSLNVTELANAVSFTYFSDIAVPASSIPIGGNFPNTSVITIYSMAVAGGTPSGLAMDNSGTIYFSMTYQAA